MSDFSVYFHIPYCLHKCGYCDFNTYATRTFPEAEYAAALERELRAASSHEDWAGRKVATAFFGGGTPSLFSARTIETLLDAVGECFGFAPHPEISLEANPATIEGGSPGKLREFHAAGINRASIGVQSFKAQHLDTLDRIHSVADALGTLEAAVDAGFESVSCDLIFAIPGQSVDEWQDDLETAVSVGVDHISAYNLTYEKGTAITGARDRGMVQPVLEDDELEMFDNAVDLLTNAGFEHYEISNYARPGHRCRHNLVYWKRGDYLGLGAGAHGFVTRTAQSPDGLLDGRRYANLRLPVQYMSAPDGQWAMTREDVTTAEGIAEFVMLNLRLREGFADARFHEQFGVWPDTTLERLEDLCRKGLLERASGTTRLTARGLQLADHVIGELTLG